MAVNCAMWLEPFFTVAYVGSSGSVFGIAPAVCFCTFFFPMNNMNFFPANIKYNMKFQSRLRIFLHEAFFNMKFLFHNERTSNYLAFRDEPSRVVVQSNC